jgi:glycosyltransferase involved in cell wall biosynthesis
MKILQVGTGAIKMPPDRYGGVELYIYHVARHMVRAGHDVTILDIKESDADPDTEYIDGIKFIRLSTKKVNISSRSFIVGYVRSRINTALFALKANRYVKKGDFDIIHLHSTLIGLVLIFLNRRLRGRMVHTVHSPSWFLPSLGRVERLALALDYHLMRRVGRVIAVTSLLTERLKAMGKNGPGNITVVHEGVETDRFTPDVDGDGVRKEYGLNGRVTILFVGRIVPYKGVEYLVKAADIVVNQKGMKNAMFLLVGPLFEYGLDRIEHSEYISRLFGFIKESSLEENVKLTGAMPYVNLPRFFSACDIFVLPSLAETFGLVASQAMASGKPVVGTRIAGIVDQVKDGWNGYLVEPADEHQLAEKIEYLIDHPGVRKTMGLNGRKLAEEEFDWSVASDRILKVYQTAL